MGQVWRGEKHERRVKVEIDRAPRGKSPRDGAVERQLLADLTIKVSNAVGSYNHHLECAFRYSSSCSMLIIFKPQSRANLKQSSRLAMDPSGSSGFTNSQMMPAAGRPASLHRSARGRTSATKPTESDLRNAPTEASVWPLRVRTPPSTARRGTRCPGRVKSSGLEEGSANLTAVRARSCAEIPVVVPKGAGQQEHYPSYNLSHYSPCL